MFRAVRIRNRYCPHGKGKNCIGMTLTAKDIFDEAKAGDASANELINQLGEFLGIALASVANVTNPQIFVIGGGCIKGRENPD